MAQTRLVIVDDDPIFRLDLKQLLQGLGYLVAAEVADARSALEAARALRPDLVIMDIQLEGAPDGITAAATLTAERLAPVLLLTGFGDLDLIQRAKDAGVVGYLMKPIT
jgi:response regulator NasT